MSSALTFTLPSELEATEPGRRGDERDAVWLMVASRSGGEIAHARFRDLPSLLQAGDVLVVNTSATLRASLAGHGVRVHVSTPARGEPGAWMIELRSADGANPRSDGRPGDRIHLAGGATATLERSDGRFWVARFDVDVHEHLARHGEPIRYGYVKRPRPLADYQTVFATHAGSAEMPSAGRPFTHALVTRLAAAGVLFAPLTLHCGVSSPERHEPPYAEPFDVPQTTAAVVNAARERGGRVIAVGTTAVRALETATGDDGVTRAASGWTDLVISDEVCSVAGLITGWHEPEASHLQLLEAVAGTELLARCYEEALERGYLWHEFGDSHLILP